MPTRCWCIMAISGVAKTARITGSGGDRIALLMTHDINLFAYHLPLDAHPDVGNNVALARVLDSPSRDGSASRISAFTARLREPLRLDALGNAIGERLSRNRLS